MKKLLILLAILVSMFLTITSPLGILLVAMPVAGTISAAINYITVAMPKITRANVDIKLVYMVGEEEFVYEDTMHIKYKRAVGSDFYGDGRVDIYTKFDAYFQDNHYNDTLYKIDNRYSVTYNPPPSRYFMGEFDWDNDEPECRVFDFEENRHIDNSDNMLDSFGFRIIEYTTSKPIKNTFPKNYNPGYEYTKINNGEYE